jgi:hypothetical protein
MCSDALPQMDVDMFQFLREHDSSYLLPNARDVVVPGSSASARQCILNALRTICPAQCKFSAHDIVETNQLASSDLDMYFIIQDFFYKDCELRMMLLSLDNFRVYDAFVLREDILHILKSRKIVANDAELDVSFKGFFVRDKDMQWVSLHKAFCCSVKAFKYNPALETWFAEAYLFNHCSVFDPPKSWRALDQSLSGTLYTSPALPNLTSSGACDHLGCICHDDSVPVPELLRRIPSLANKLLTQWVQPQVTALQLYETIMNKFLAGMDAKQDAGAVAANPTFNDRGERLRCLFHRNCTQPASCYWIQCCKPDVPVGCKQHSMEHFQKDAITADCGMSMCPKHHVSGRFATLMI